jgi:hypothetical protein
MGISYNPKLVTDGMVLCFDPANQNTYPTTNPENLLLWSNDFSRNVWGGYCGSKRNQTYNTNEVLAPDGTYTATKIQRTLNNTCTGADSNEVSFGIVWDSTPGGSIVSTGQTYTASIYARGINGGEALYFGLDDSNRDLNIVLTTSWQRYTYTGVISQSPTRGLQTTLISPNAGCYIWGAQVETGPVATTYTQTTTSPVRRTFRDLNSGSSSTLITNYALNTTAYGVPVLEINNNGTTSGGQVQVNTQVDLDYLARTQNFTVMFAAKKNFYGLSGNNNGSSQLFQGAVNGYTSGWRLYDNNQGTPGSAFSSRHSWGFGYNDINTGLTVNDTASNTNRMCVVAFTVSPTTMFAFCNGTTASRSNPLTYVSGTNAPFISFTGAGAGSFNGLLGYFAIYNRALSQTEIEQNYAVLRTRYGI